MILHAAQEHDVDLAQSFFIGDKPSDIDCGRNAGVKTILVRGDDFAAATQRILNE